jgi:predicted transposase/invertase (TIGR01784 family)
MSKTDRPLISFDWALKKLLRNKANFVILEGFLSVLLKKDIVIIQILESESNSIMPELKTNRVDLLVENDKKERIIIELQYSQEYAFLFRMLFATSTHIVENMPEGVDYENVKKVYSINLIYFDLGHGKDYVYHGKNEFRGIHHNDVLQLTEKQKTMFSKDEVYQIYPEYYVIKINNFDDVAKDSLDEWIYYFKKNAIKEEFSAKGLDEVRKLLRLDDLDKGDRFAYKKYMENLSSEKGMIKSARFDGLWEGKIIGLEQGLALAEEKRKQSIIKALKRGKLSIEEIAEDYEVSIELIISIKKELN